MAQKSQKVAQDNTVDVKAFVMRKMSVLNLKNPAKYQETMKALQSLLIKK